MYPHDAIPQLRALGQEQVGAPRRVKGTPLGTSMDKRMPPGVESAPYSIFKHPSYIDAHLYSD